MSTQSRWLARRALLETSERPAIFATDGQASHLELGRRSSAIASALLAGRPSLKGTRVALLASPSVAWIVGFFGIIKAGGVVAPLCPLYPDRELLYILNDAEVETTLVDSTYVDRATATSLSPRILRLEEISSTSLSSHLPDCSDTDGALVLYTSGTTGKPKGALLSHGNLAEQTRILGKFWGITDQDRLLHALPLHHMHGVVIALLTTLQAGGCAELLPRFDATQIWEAFARSTVWMAVPTMYHKLLDALDQASDSVRERWTSSARGLRLVTSGSAALPATLASRWEAVTGSIPLERFGMTELGVALSNPLRKEQRKIGSVGVPLPGVEVRICTHEENDALPGETGEILVRGPTLFSGYLGQKELTSRAFREGWFLTGDTATRDSDGFVRILGRTSVDIIKSGGYKLSALEIEETLREHPAVREVAVVGLPDETWGERVVAGIVLQSTATQSITSDTIREFCRNRIASYKIPRQLFFLNELPRNTMGKVMKPALVQALLSQGSPSSP